MPTLMLLKGLGNLPSIPGFKEMEHRYGDNLERMYVDHNKLIGMILTEEEDMIERRSQPEMPVEHLGHRILVKCTQLQWVSISFQVKIIS